MHSSAYTYSPITKEWGDYTIGYNEDPKDTSHTTTDLTANGDGTFSIKMIPADYYGVTGDTVITGLAIVFNNGTWDKEGKDKGATATECVNFKVPLQNATTSVGTESNVSFSVYPNPVVSEMVINNDKNISYVVISDIIGKVVLKIAGNNTGSIELATTNMPQGLYIVSVYDIKGFAGSAKFVKK